MIVSLKKINLSQVLLIISLFALVGVMLWNYLIFTKAETTISVNAKAGAVLDDKTYQAITDAQKTDTTIQHNGNIGRDNPFDPLP